MKRLMSLGGNYFQMTAVKAAKRLGCYVIDVDYLPENPAHKYADEYVNVSTTDKEAVLKVAREKNIDGIIAYASDVSAPTAAYVAEQLGLPTNPYESVCIMTQKDKFHPFLKENGFFVPENKLVENPEDIKTFMRNYSGDVLVKPVSSSGSKGVTRISDLSQAEGAFEEAFKYARGTGIVVEEFIKRKGHQVAGDAFLVDGKIAFFGIMNEHFNDHINGLVPVGESYPSDLTSEERELAKNEIERALNLLGMKNGAINLDFMIDEHGRVFIIELGPRNGGNLITDAIQVATGVDLGEYTVKAALGEDMSDLKEVPQKKLISSYIWHTEKDQVYNGLKLTRELEEKVIQSDMFLEKGEKISKFTNGGFGIGAALIEFDSKEQMIEMMDHMNDYYEVL